MKMKRTLAILAVVLSLSMTACANNTDSVSDDMAVSTDASVNETTISATDETSVSDINGDTSISVEETTENNLTAAIVMSQVNDAVSAYRSAHLDTDADITGIVTTNDTVEEQNMTSKMSSDIAINGTYSHYVVSETVANGETESYEYEEYQTVYDGTSDMWESYVYTNESGVWRYYISEEKITRMRDAVSEMLMLNIDGAFDNAKLQRDGDFYIVSISLADIPIELPETDDTIVDSETMAAEDSFLFGSLGIMGDMAMEGTIDYIIDCDTMLPVSFNIADMFCNVMDMGGYDMDGDGTDDTYKVDMKMNVAVAFSDWSKDVDVPIPDEIRNTAEFENRYWGPGE